MADYIDRFDVNGEEYELRDSGAARADETSAALGKKVDKDTASAVAFTMGYDAGGLYVITD